MQKGKSQKVRVGDDRGLLRVMYPSGAVVEHQLLAGAFAIVRSNAQVVCKDDKPISPELVVACQRELAHCNMTRRQLLVGTPIDAVNPESAHQFYVLPWNRFVPILIKSSCRSVGECSDADDSCGSCCNRPKK